MGDKMFKSNKRKLTTEEQQMQLLLSRRRFVRNTSLALATAGVAASTRINLVEELSRKLFPAAYANENDVKRMIYIGVRSGIPVIGMAVNGPFNNNQNLPIITPNFPYAGNQVRNTGVNNLHLTPASDNHLRRHAENLAVTQGVRTEGGHTSLFNFWQGGFGQGRTSPIIDLADRNTSQSMLPGVHFLSRNPGASRRVTHQTNGKADLTTVHERNFVDNFRKPSLMLTEDEAQAVMGAAARLSRRQALRMQQIVDNPVNVAMSHFRGAEMLNVDYSSALGIGDMGRITAGSGPHVRFGRGLAYTLKAMSLNLVNSATVELSVGDWHGLRNDSITRPYYESVAEKLGLAADYMKATPDPASPGKTLWETTVIAVGTEFTRRDRTFGEDNGDGGSQGILLLGDSVKGGYYGDISYVPGSGRDTVLRFQGFDPATGQAMSGLNTTSQLYHTINRIVDNPGVDSRQVWTSFINRS